MDFNQEGLTVTDQIDFSTSIEVPISGWVPNIEPGKKCQHGVYIPSTQEDQTFAENCQVCTSLRDFLDKHDMTMEEIEARQRIFRSHLSKDDIEDYLKAFPIRRHWTFAELDKIDTLIQEGESAEV